MVHDGPRLTGTLFVYGIVVGAIALSGLSLLLAAARRTSHRGREARRGLERSRRQTAAVSQDRDDLISQRDAARASTAGALGNGPDSGDHRPRARGSRPGWLMRSRSMPASDTPLLAVTRPSGAGPARWTPGGGHGRSATVMVTPPRGSPAVGLPARPV
jgi:hypothetical protein